jgi:hypothetical protein
MVSIAPIMMYDADWNVALQVFEFDPRKLTLMNACCMHPNSWIAAR